MYTSGLLALRVRAMAFALACSLSTNWRGYWVSWDAVTGEGERGLCESLKARRESPSASRLSVSLWRWCGRACSRRCGMAGRFAPETRVRATRDIHRSQLSGTDTESHWFTVDTGHGWPDMIKLDMAPLKDVVACCDLPAESGSPPRRSDADGESHDHGLRRPACSRSGSSSQPSVGAALPGVSAVGWPRAPR